MRFRLAIITSLLLVTLFVVTIVAAPGSFLSAESETAPSEDMMIVSGTVYDSGGLPVVGADVNVSMYDGATLRSYQTDVSDSSGVYAATFGPMMGGEPWGVGDTILVVADDGECSGTNSTVAGDDLFPEIDVKLTTMIPEFGNLGALVPIVGILGIFMVFFFARKERNG